MTCGPSSTDGTILLSYPEIHSRFMSGSQDSLLTITLSARYICSGYCSTTRRKGVRLYAKHWLFMASVMLHMEARAHQLDRVSHSTSTFPTYDPCSSPGDHCAHLASGENGLRYFSGTPSSTKHTL